LPLDGGRLDECTDASRELCIDDANSGRRFPTNGGTQFGCRRSFDHPNAFRPQHRHNLVEAVMRRIWCYDGELQLSSLCRVSNLLDSDDHKPSIHADAE